MIKCTVYYRVFFLNWGPFLLLNYYSSTVPSLQTSQYFTSLTDSFIVSFPKLFKFDLEHKPGKHKTAFKGYRDFQETGPWA